MMPLFRPEGAQFEWKPPRLVTARLVLRPLVEADAEGVFAYASNPNVARFTLWDAHRSPAESLLFITDYAVYRYVDQEPEPVGIALRERPDWIIGTVGCFWVSKPHAVMEIGYALGEEHWGRGYASEACAALLDWVFGEYPLERMQARVVHENEASARVLEKLGFQYEGTLRSSMFRYGVFRDVDSFSVLRAEWAARGPADSGHG